MDAKLAPARLQGRTALFLFVLGGGTCEGGRSHG